VERHGHCLYRGNVAVETFPDIKWQPMIEPNRRGPDLLPVIILLAILGVACAGLWLFPYVQAVVERQNCVAVGRDDCG
jgi:hypothetical protein